MAIVSRIEELSPEVVFFLMAALLEGRISRPAACALVRPWVEGDRLVTSSAEAGAQLIHGFDVVIGIDGLARHESQSASGEYAVAESEMIERIRAWLDRHSGT